MKRQRSIFVDDLMISPLAPRIGPMVVDAEQMILLYLFHRL